MRITRHGRNAQDYKMTAKAGKDDNVLTRSLRVDSQEWPRKSASTAFFGLLRGRVGWLVVAAAMYVVLNIVVAPAGFYPIHQDDYVVLGSGLERVTFFSERPVSNNIAFLLGYLGSVASYAVLNLLTVLVPVLVLWFVSVFLQVRVKWPAAVLCFAIVFGDASAFEHGKYLGLISNLCSHFFGTCSLLLLLWAARGGDRSRAAWAGSAFLLSAFSKEDFLLPVAIMAAVLLLEQARAKGLLHPGTRRAGGALLMVGLLIGAAVAYNLLRSSPFLAGMSGPPVSSAAAYAVDTNPLHLVSSFWRLTATYVPLASIAALIGLAAAWALAPSRRLRLACLALMTCSLVLPYALIPNNSPGYRAFAWLPWLAATAAIGIQLVSDRVTARSGWSKIMAGVLVLALSATAVYFLWRPRMVIAGWYGQVQAMNSRMGRSLVTHRAAILAAPQVAVIGMEGLSPWSNNNGEYLSRRLGFRGVWVVFVNGNSDRFHLDPPGFQPADLPPADRITVQPLSRLCEWPDIPALTYDGQGTGVLGTTASACASMRGANAPR
ncbi:MAG: hypothetical protein WKF61_05560 [Luteimonas sp.]